MTSHRAFFDNQASVTDGMIGDQVRPMAPDLINTPVGIGDEQMVTDTDGKLYKISSNDLMAAQAAAAMQLQDSQQVFTPFRHCRHSLRRISTLTRTLQGASVRIMEMDKVKRKVQSNRGGQCA